MMIAEPPVRHEKCNNLPDSIKFKKPSKGQYKFDEVNLEDPIVWAAFTRADCGGIFQVETGLGQYWTKQLKPSNISELSDVISLVRPGPLESLETEKYAKRKSGEEPLEYLDPSLESILYDTQGIICYQEQCSEIVMKLAGFTEAEANLFRKNISKKNSEEVNKCKNEFISKAEKLKVITKEKAEEIFAIMQKFQRYGFCRAHGIEYALNSYFSMYAKVHFPTEFYCAWLTFSCEKPEPKEEIYNLVQDARLHNIQIFPPDIRRKNVDFEILEDRKIVFGLSHIRGVGSTAIEKIGKLDNIDSFEELLVSCKTLNKSVVEGLIKSGACDCYKIPRSQMLKTIHAVYGRNEKDASFIAPEVKPLTTVELKHFLMYFNENKSVLESLNKILENGKCIKKRIPTIEAKIKYIQISVQDTNRSKSIWEKLYLGLNLTCSAADDVDKTEEKTTSCKDALKLPPRSKMIMHCVIDKITHRKTGEKSKNPGQDYCFLNVSDNTCAIQNVALWPDKYELFKEELAEDLVVTLYARRNSWNGRENIVVDDLNIIG